MDGPTRRLVAVAATLLAAMVVGGVVAVVAGWPAQFGGAGDADEVGREALTRGTALSPPLVPVVAYGAALALAARGGRAGTTGTVLLMLLSAVFVIGGLGEALAEPTADVPRAALVTSGVIAAVLGSGVIAAGVQRIRRRT